MQTKPFEISDSIISSVSVSEIRTSIITPERESNLLYSRFKPVTNTTCISSSSNKSMKAKKYIILSSLILIPLIFFVLLRSWLYSFSYSHLMFPPNYLKGIIDNNEYQLVQLQNNIEFALVSNNNCSISSFLILISYGSSNDPEDLAGLAHIAIKTKLTMPMRDFVQKHHKQIKHFNMSYHIDEEISRMSFEIDNSFFWQSINALVNSLTNQAEPSDDLLEDSLESLQRAYYSLKGSDYYRELTIINSLLYERDNFIGNDDTLKKNDNYTHKIKKELSIAVNKFYIGNNMKIVIETGDRIENIRDKVTSMFNRINYESIPSRNKTNENIIRYSNIGKVLWIQSHVYMKNLKLLFIIPQSSKQAFIYYEYLSYLLNKKEENSLYMKLSSLNLIRNIESKLSRALTTHLQFELNFNLTKHGIDSIPLITTKAFGHLSNMTNSGIDQKRFDEFVNIKKLLKLYCEEDQRDRIKRLSLYLRNKLSIGDYMNFTSKSYFVNSNMNNYLIPKQSLIILETDKIDFIKYKIISNEDLIICQYEKHFKTMYYSKDLTKEDINKLNNVANEPINSKWTLNPFMTNNFNKIDFDEKQNRKEKIEMEPTAIIRDKRIVVWHRVSYFLLSFFLFSLIGHS